MGAPQGWWPPPAAGSAPTDAQEAEGDLHPPGPGGPACVRLRATGCSEGEGTGVMAAWARLGASGLQGECGREGCAPRTCGRRAQRPAAAAAADGMVLAHPRAASPREAGALAPRFPGQGSCRLHCHRGEGGVYGSVGDGGRTPPNREEG